MEHLENKINKYNRIIGSINKLSPKDVFSDYLYNFYYIILISIYITDIIHDKQEHESFKDLLEKIQHKAALAITGVIRGT